jgi:stage II sporulation protein D
MQKRHLFLLTMAVVFSFCPLLLGGNPDSQPEVRVAIVQDTGSLSIRISGAYEIVNPADQKVLSRGRNLKVTAAVSRNAILLGTEVFNQRSVAIRAGDSLILIDGRKFAGSIQLVRKDNGRLLVINRIGLEDYVKGILYHEVSHYWPMEVLKAQAIVCRTYAVYQIQESKRRDYDVTSDTYSQVYGGRTSERYRTTKAVEQTRGQVLAYRDKILPAYFHAVCGGHTEDASMLWNTELPPLKGLACPYCKEAPHYQWHAVLSLSEIEDKLQAAGYPAYAHIKDIQMLDRDASGRLANLKIITDTKEATLPAKDFRNAIGPNVIRSANFTVRLADRDAVFEGFGWGHGVGMCQWGAYFMAKQGSTYKQILLFYYPKTDVKALGF